MERNQGMFICNNIEIHCEPFLPEVGDCDPLIIICIKVYYVYYITFVEKVSAGLNLTEVS